MKIPEHILLIDKPKGITSFDVIRILRRKLGIKKLGHAGTLDPLASGLMLIGVGEGTKKLFSLLKLSKVYQTEILLGIQTDTGDLEGKVIAEQTVEKVEETAVKKVMKDIVGVLELPVPLYSAIKREGKALYKYAREGKEVEIPIKKMEVLSAQSYDTRPRPNGYLSGRANGCSFGRVSYEKGKCILKLELEVASGTYIRSVAEEIGRRLGYPAVVKELRRISIGDFKIGDAETI